MSNSAQTLASRRIKTLLDDHSFVEIGAYVTARSTDFNLAAKTVPGDGVVTGYGTVNGSLVYIYSQDAQIMGGAMGEMNAKKISNLYALAMKMGAPIVGLVDCAGMRMEEASDALYSFSKLYLDQTMASGVIPQINGIFGRCAGGMAVSCALSDFTFMENKHATMFVNSPNTLLGNHTLKSDTSSVVFQEQEAGMVDFSGSEEEILEAMRNLLSILPSNNEDDASYDPCDDDLNRVCQDLESYVKEPAMVLSTISDESFFMEMKRGYAPSMVTGFIRLNGITIGCVANRVQQWDEDGNIKEEYEAVLTAQGCEKAASFVDFCDAFGIPLLTLVNVGGYSAFRCSEKKIARAAADLTYAFANATVPKVSVILQEAKGTASLVMNSKGIGADVVYAWPQAQIGVMDAVSAVKVMYEEEISQSQDPVRFIEEKAKEYEVLQSSAMAAAKRGYIDDIIEPKYSRGRIVVAFEMLFTKREDRPGKKHGSR